MMNTTRADLRLRRWSLHLTAITATFAALLAFSASNAGATASIEGVWSFESGQIVVETLPNGEIQGTVVTPTKFAECTHESGEKIWTDIEPQPDGSYYGHHQWFYADGKCEKNPEPGLTAWRVLEESNGSKYLLVCLSEPGKSQPSISPGGESHNASYGCIKSALISKEVPRTEAEGGSGSSGTGSKGGSGATGGSGVANSVERLTFPSTKQCLSARRFQIHLAEPKYDPFKTVTVTVKGHKLATVHRGNYLVTTINLQGLKHGAFSVTIHATTVLGHHLSGTRTYHTCANKAKHSKPHPLH